MTVVHNYSHPIFYSFPVGMLAYFINQRLSVKCKLDLFQ